MDDNGFRAGIELTGRVMRYAEVERGDRGARPRLVRLGACDFDFDVADAILDLTGPTHLDTVAAAIEEIFDGTEARRLAVIVHPWNTTSFFSPVREGTPPVERLEQFKQEAAMLADASAGRPVRVRATPVRIEALPDGSRHHWHHVLRLPESVHARLAHLAKPLGRDRRGRDGGHEFVDSAGAAAAIATRLTYVEDEEDPGFALAVGMYPGHLELALVQGETWHFGHHAEADVLSDGAYYAAALLNRLAIAPSSVDRLLVYGAAADSSLAASLSGWLGIEPEPLNPLRLFGLAPAGADPYALTAYAPCLGALLR